MKKEIEKRLEYEKKLPSSWIVKISIVKMVILPKMTYQFNTIFIKLSIVFFRELEKKDLKICMEYQNAGSNQELISRIQRTQKIKNRNIH